MCSLWGSIFWQHLTYVITPCKTEFGAYLHIESSLGADIDLESCASSYLLAPRTTQSLQWSLSCMPFSGGASQPSVLAAQYARAFASPVQLAATSFSPKNTRTDLKQEPKFCLFPPFYMSVTFIFGGTRFDLTLAYSYIIPHIPRTCFLSLHARRRLQGKILLSKSFNFGTLTMEQYPSPNKLTSPLHQDSLIL